jgi:glycosyltransferase involved in cell wall biosynthesis
MKTLHVVPHLNLGFIRRELDLLLATQLDSAVEVLHGRNWFDPRRLWTLAGRLRDIRPDVVCAWGLPALRAVRVAAPKTAVVVRKPWTDRGALSPWDRWLLRGVERILVSTRAEAAGLPADKVRVVPTVVAAPGGSVREFDPPRIVCVGPLVPERGFYEAIWAFDILQFVHPTVELVIAGEGPERRRLEQFAERIGQRGRIQLPAAADVGELLAGATVVWVPSFKDRGVGIALQALAAGRPVVASRGPRLAEVIAEAETGYLVPPANKMALAGRTRLLLEDDPLRQRLGAAGWQWARDHCAPDTFVRAWSLACARAAA